MRGSSEVPECGNLTFCYCNMILFALGSRSSGAKWHHGKGFLSFPITKSICKQFIVDFLCNLAWETSGTFAELNSRLADIEQWVHLGEHLSTLLEDARAELEEYLSHLTKHRVLSYERKSRWQ